LKYRRLTREQFEELHLEFSQFLASQSIDQQKWENLKASDIHEVALQLDSFSDWVWETTLRQTVYIDHFSPGSYFGFHAGQKSLMMVGVKTGNNLDLTLTESWKWLQAHWKDESVSFYKEQKPYTLNRTKVLFDLIEKGGVLAGPETFERLSKRLSY